LSVSRALIRAGAVNDAREQNERAATKKRSDVHAKMFPRGFATRLVELNFLRNRA
jgi:hypothetical protein